MKQAPALLPDAFTLRRASDVFPTNNTMLRKSALRLSGLFDLAYEHGPRADGDLGMRLYLSGARMLLDPEIRVLHHHAPSGGLRTHKAPQSHLRQQPQQFIPAQSAQRHRAVPGAALFQPAPGARTPVAECAGHFQPAWFSPQAGG